MWDKDVSPELLEAAHKYKSFFGCSPDTYDAVCYESFSCEFFLKVIYESIEANLELDNYLDTYPDTNWFEE